MSVAELTEFVVEDAAVASLEDLGWVIKHGPDISPGWDTLTPALSQWERVSHSQVVLDQRLCDPQARLNPALLPEAHRMFDQLRIVSNITQRHEQIGDPLSAASGGGARPAAS